jgi:hypothetical protein
MRSLDVSIYVILPAALWPRGLTQPLTVISTRNLSGGKGRPVRKADNLTAICRSIVYKKCEPRRLTTIWASAACYRDSLLYLFIFDSKHTGCSDVYHRVRNCCNPCFWRQWQYSWLQRLKKSLNILRESIFHLRRDSTQNYEAVILMTTPELSINSPTIIRRTYDKNLESYNACIFTIVSGHPRC